MVAVVAFLRDETCTWSIPCSWVLIDQGRRTLIPVSPPSAPGSVALRLSIQTMDDVSDSLFTSKHGTAFRVLAHQQLGIPEPCRALALVVAIARWHS